MLKDLAAHLGDLDGLVPLRAAEQVPLALAHGLVLAVDVMTPLPMPPFTSSAMDGYAVRAADLPGTLTQVAEVPAGTVPTRPVGAGECQRVMTGAVLPSGADTIVPIEHVVLDGPAVRFARSVDPGAYVRRAGSDAPAGTLVLAAGVRLTASRLAVLASSRRDHPLGAPSTPGAGRLHR